MIWRGDRIRRLYLQRSFFCLLSYVLKTEVKKEWETCLNYADAILILSYLHNLLRNWTKNRIFMHIYSMGLFIIFRSKFKNQFFFYSYFLNIHAYQKKEISSLQPICHILYWAGVSRFSNIILKIKRFWNQTLNYIFMKYSYICILVASHTQPWYIGWGRILINIY